MQMSSLPSRLGSPLCMEICVQGLGLSSPGRQSCTESGFAAVCALWPYISNVHISITCLLQRLFQRESKAWLNIPSRGTARLIPTPHELNDPRALSSTWRNALH